MTQDIPGLQGQLACPEPQVSKAPKAEREVPGFQASQVHRAIPVKEVLPGSPGHQVSLGPQAVQVLQAGKDSEGTRGLLDQLE